MHYILLIHVFPPISFYLIYSSLSLTIFGFGISSSSGQLKSLKVGSPAVRGATVVHSPEVTSPMSDSIVGGGGDSSVENPAQVSFDCDTSQERLNLPAVLWDKPLGSKIRVPPPVPPRSPKRPPDAAGDLLYMSNHQDVRGWIV